MSSKDSITSEAEQVTVQLDVPGTVPPVVLGLTDRACVLIGERIGAGNDPHAQVNWISRIAPSGAGLDALQQALETISADQRLLARQRYPSPLRARLRGAVAGAPDRGITLGELEAMHLVPQRIDLINELARMKEDGEVTFSGPRYWWAGKQLAV